MLILAVDTSTRMGSAALLCDSQVLAEISGYEETPYSTRLFRDIAVLQDRAGFRLDQVDVFAVAAGPGSFTGLRVGLTAVKAWSEVHGKPIAAISGLEAIAAEALMGETARMGGTSKTGETATMREILSASNTRLVAPFLDARRGQVFGAIYRRIPENAMDLALASDESILSLDEFLELVKGRFPQPIQLVSPTPEVLPAARIQEVLQAVPIVQVSAALAPAIGRLGFERAKRGDLVDSIRLDANYVRRSDAASAWTDG
ncbi:MAG TPA: tRNA (adenosine(37)-N6)-threonylcarbamoyltransferase complex dimerization subunit type 1 TsaB [Candidatus Acidoferrales bacterium]|jgi:tRNA threonylcarbamoyladenosine biosynthesis protein TsaB|nr:tRNA (adenosine(37)-N6)-threonylcarbamoyltransferase complex dimerization subunit type 1 TsaB [Candidatus Acidoferrales bacterium]